MTSTPFDFLKAEFPRQFDHAPHAGAEALRDARTSCFYTRLAIESAITWAFDHDASLRRPYENNLSALLHEPSFKDQLPQPVFLKAKEAIRFGNRAAHESQPLSNRDAVTAISHLWEFLYWFARTYTRGEKPPPGLAFDPASLPKPGPSPAASAARIRELEAEAEAFERERAIAQAAVATTLHLEQELERLKTEVAEAKARAAAVPDEHDYTEADTRTFIIDLLLAESGWHLSQPRDREFEVVGMPTPSGKGKADYVLWGADGRPLAVIEAKRTTSDATVGQHQARLYADALEQMFGQRPVIYFTNGYETNLWDDTFAPPRVVQGFATQDELTLMVQRRETRRRLADITVNPDIAGRFYQERAIRRICESFDEQRQRKSLVVMATGAGKTRTVIALADVLIRANWTKRVLFLADRTALVDQAARAFTDLLPDSSPVNLLDDRTGEGRVYLSTHATMMNLIEEKDANGRRRFGPNHFDLVVIDEAHRSVFRKYKAIFDYFDSYRVGLTATPKSEIDRNTYDLFDLETGVPTDEYGLDAAVADGFLVPFQAMSVPLKFQRQGIRYEDLSDEEKEAWDEIDWEDDPPDDIGAEAVNRWLFNADTVDKVLAHVMTNGLKTEGGDRLAKTIVFAKNQRHADFIVQRFDANYPHYKGEFARVITNRTTYVKSLIGQFSVASGDPRMAVSVDMLDTGIDVPEVANLVFFKIVRSKTKFWQMVGRGTRLCPDLFGPGQHKESFRIFDFCQNLEFFGQNHDDDDHAGAVPLSTRLFSRRIDLIEAMDAAGTHAAHRRDLAELLRSEVSTMNPDNFVVRPHRKLVERFRDAGAWTAPLPTDASAMLRTTVATLPTELESERVESKQFDLVMLNVQLALITADPTYLRLRDQVRAIASILEEHDKIPAVRTELQLISELQTDEWWADATITMVESARTRLRRLVPLIEKRKREPLYTNFADEIGEGVEVPLGPGSMGDFSQFRKKALAFLREHDDHLTIRRLRSNQPVTPADLEELGRMLAGIGGGTEANIERAATESGGLGLFVRSLIGMEINAAKAAFAPFLNDARFNGNQIDYVNMIVDHLAADGVIEPSRFYESPYTDVAPQGPDGLFESNDVDRLIDAVHQIRATAMAG